MSTSLFVGSHGQQGVARGTNPLAGGVVGGAFSYAQSVTAYELKTIVEQTRIPTGLALDADAAPRVATNTVVPFRVLADSDVMIGNRADVAVPVNVDPVAAGSPRGRAAVPAVPIVVGAGAAATGRITAAVQAALRWGATATAIPRITAAVLFPLQLRTSGAVMLTIRAAVVAPLKWLIGIIGRVPIERPRRLTVAKAPQTLTPTMPPHTLRRTEPDA